MKGEIGKTENLIGEGRGSQEGQRRITVRLKNTNSLTISEIHVSLCINTHL